MEDLAKLFQFLDTLISMPFDVYGFTLSFKGLLIFCIIITILGSFVARIFFDN